MPQFYGGENGMTNNRSGNRIKKQDKIIKNMKIPHDVYGGIIFKNNHVSFF